MDRVSLSCLVGMVAKPFLFFAPARNEEKTMQVNELKVLTELNEQTKTVTSTDQPAVIASRQRCEADGVGLSHYILMDTKKAAE